MPMAFLSVIGPQRSGLKELLDGLLLREEIFL